MGPGDHRSLENMTETIRCPDCGHPNPAGSESCAQCNFPIASQAESSATTPPPAAATPAVPSEPPIYLRPPRRRPRPASNQALSLWLLFAFIAAASVVYIGVKANVDRAHEPVEGSNERQQQQADQFLAALGRDSTDVQANIGIANVLYDTGNWSEAIVHYRAALRRDSSQTNALVDLGVCYYNLSQSDDAEACFLLALQRDPHQAVALYNLGIVNERRKDYDEAFQFFHRALQSEPPEDMKKAVMEAMQRIQDAQGKKAPPLPDGTSQSNR
jgi:cytochrome c-type biogenesis protein CcmH/NrfG